MLLGNQATVGASLLAMVGTENAILYCLKEWDRMASGSERLKMMDLPRTGCGQPCGSFQCREHRRYAGWARLEGVETRIAKRYTHVDDSYTLI